MAHWQHLRVLAAQAALSGRFDSARSQSEAAGQIATRMGDPFDASITVGFAAVLPVMRGDPREIPTNYRASFTAIAQVPVVNALCPYLNNRHEEALAKYEYLRLLLREPIPGVRGTAVLQLVTELVEAFDDSEAAAWAHARWLPWAAAAGLPGNATTFCFGSCARADVLRRRAGTGDHTEAASLTARAAAEARRLDMP